MRVAAPISETRDRRSKCTIIIIRAIIIRECSTLRGEDNARRS